MPSELLVSRFAGRALAAVREDGAIVELHVQRDGEPAGVGDVVLGRVTRYAGALRSVFVDVGLERDAFLHASDLFRAGDAPAARGSFPADRRIPEGEPVVIQVVREAGESKGLRATGHVSLPGRLLVYLPRTLGPGVSRRIDDPEERERLRAIVDPLAEGRGGFVVRTAARGASEEELRADAALLVAAWDEIARRAAGARPPARLHRGSDLLLRALRDAPPGGYHRIVLDAAEDRDRAARFLDAQQPGLGARARLHSGPGSLLESEGIDRALERALRPKVWLPSGAFLVIESTEALVAVDVNTGRSPGKRDPEETALATNLEASVEIARQIRLRDLGGIVVVDFIDMERPEHRSRVVEELERALAADRSPARVTELGAAGLVSITRRRGRRGLADQMLELCPSCRGLGRVKGPDRVAHEAIEEARRIAGALDRPKVSLRAHPEVAREIARALARGGAEALEGISVEADPALLPDHYQIVAR